MATNYASQFLGSCNPQKSKKYGNFYSNTGAWQLLWLTLCQLHTRVEVEFLPVYQPSEAEKANPKLYAYNVRKIMADALGIPFTDHTYDDCRLMVKSKDKNLPHRTGLVEFTKLHDKLGLSWNQVTLSRFFMELASGLLGYLLVYSVVCLYDLFACSTLLASFINQFICSFIHLLIHSLAHSFICSFIHLFIHLLIHSLAHSFTCSFISSHIH